MKTTSAPPEFLRLGSCFIQDDADWGMNNFPEWAKQAIVLTHLPPAKISSLKAFIDEILSSPNDAFVDRMWNSMGAPMQVHVRGDKTASTRGLTRGWFKTIRELLDTVKVTSFEGKR
ncbi:hypothetical protein DFR50_107167 [Roseiarcus fermentans]|uniref:Uncharacterized protein n=1 Tax=Roseiarcus fermentans TaxID=1473586 RepID=A0A366FMR1_9HYPH|nr:hypothetical protein [Roseiarcus fermentans]RBP15897.1 hypothetical protein DFR50_107167 [Roseiarcus fermentans]